MPRYNPQNKAHRKTLADRIEKMLLGSGFCQDPSSRGEDVYTRDVDGTSAKVRVLTSIFNGEVRQKAKDAIRVCAILENGDETYGLVKSKKINRTGDFDAITGRLLTAMRTVYKTARNRALDEAFVARLTEPEIQPQPTLQVGDLVTIGGRGTGLVMSTTNSGATCRIRILWHPEIHFWARRHLFAEPALFEWVRHPDGIWMTVADYDIKKIMESEE